MNISRRSALGRIAAVPLAGSILLSERAHAAPTPFTDIGPFYPVARLAEEDGDLTLIGSQADKKQWAYKNHPLYTYGDDKAPGDVRGEGADGEWYVVKP